MGFWYRAVFEIRNIQYKFNCDNIIEGYLAKGKTAVYKCGYKDVNKISKKDPVFEIIGKDNNNFTKPKSNKKSIKKAYPPIQAKSKRKSPESKPNWEPHTLNFDANFEGGNLYWAMKITAQEYHLFLHPDTNTGGHTQWFYYRIQNMQKGISYTFKIMNFKKKRSAFSKGMSPSVFSTQKYNDTHAVWEVTECTNVRYETNPVTL